MLGGLLGISFSASAWNDDGYGIAYDKGAVRRGDGGGNTTDMSGWHCEEVKTKVRDMAGSAGMAHNRTC